MYYIIEAGHGGMAFGDYIQAGKQSPEVPPGIYEGEFNRAVMKSTVEILNEKEDAEAIALNPGPVAIPLRDRIKCINRIHKNHSDLVFVSIHANASGDPGWSKTHGPRVFIAPRCSQKSEAVAAAVTTTLSYLTDFEVPIKRRNFAMIQRTKCPAVLVECGFMTSLDDAREMARDDYRRELALAISTALISVD